MAASYTSRGSKNTIRTLHALQQEPHRTEARHNLVLCRPHAVLQIEDEYTKVTRLVPKGPADKQGELHPSDRIVGVGQGEEGEIEDVIGWRLDEVVELIRGPKDTTVRLEVIPAKAKATDQRKVITIVRNKVKLEEQSAQKKILEIPSGDDLLKIGVIDIPAFYIDFEAMGRDMDMSGDIYTIELTHQQTHVFLNY